MYWIYVVKCNDGTLYTGYTNNIEARIKKHNNGIGAKYTKNRRPVVLMYIEKFDDKSSAMKREYQIKQLSRIDKFKLINSPGKTVL